MHLRARAVLAVVGAVLSLTVVMPGAQAQEAPSLTVTPSTGLEDGDTVTVTGGPFPDSEFPLLTQCAEPVNPSSFDSVLARCTFRDARFDLSYDAQGNLVPETLVVRESVLTFDILTGDVVHDCTLRNDCVVIVTGYIGPGELFGLKAPIRFGPDTPSTTNDCKQSGWRNLANDQGEPFPNQGRCVSFVVARRR
jgi:hypothetical protein